MRKDNVFKFRSVLRRIGKAENLVAAGCRLSRFIHFPQIIEGVNHVNNINEIHIIREDCFISLLHSHILVGFEVTKK